MRVVLLLFPLLVACPQNVTTGYYGKAQDGYGLGTTQLCQRGPEAVRAFDALAPIIAEELNRAGLCDKPAEVLDDLRGWCGERIRACIIEQPEPCQGRGGLVAGCAGSGGFVVSTWSPPLCGPGVTVKCAATHAEQRNTLWATFVHESVELMLTRCGHYADSHSAKAFAAETAVRARWAAPLQ